MRLAGYGWPPTVGRGGRSSPQPCLSAGCTLQRACTRALRRLHRAERPGSTRTRFTATASRLRSLLPSATTWPYRSTSRWRGSSRASHSSTRRSFAAAADHPDSTDRPNDGALAAKSVPPPPPPASLTSPLPRRHSRRSLLQSAPLLKPSGCKPCVNVMHEPPCRQPDPCLSNLEMS